MREAAANLSLFDAELQRNVVTYEADMSVKRVMMNVRPHCSEVQTKTKTQ